MKHIATTALLALAFAAGAGADAYHHQGQAERLQAACAQQRAQDRQDVVKLAQAAIMERRVVLNRKDTVAQPVGDGSAVVLVEMRVPNPELLPKPPKPTPAPKATPAPAATPKAIPMPSPAVAQTGWRGWLKGWL